MTATGLSGGADFDICPLTVRSTPVGDFSGLLTNSDVVAHHSSLYVAMPLLEANTSAPANTFLVFYSNVENGQMWCPDCRDVEDVVKNAFDAEDKPKAAIYWVGSRDQWRDKNNGARVDFNVNSVPTIIRYTDGTETGRLVEGEILDSSKFKDFVAGQ
ncbi:hypothetical protein A1Q1_02653 [Trichosporon asahii var. asahii CBS 2479]|uniref:Thioredoxin domain-containing protein n=1 Tax=Trichosporon asahii var. asahii (strain ATCC 90039 / CBS 2479 / JCM 2466 / KCTC 7840 / NBRC 103889/ NCYC 2677 / UAMH 7654) TaxID=1186058 RepID=J4UBU7_TRIAS|nr:hypothetical protein A1Q1_02653 [Trichosporon asahii var. asahii CBS 2479]EJT48370.1 hypothetical protein A1Q1_02653 [Trichosporon asahii var. asahii CBS 2479]